MAASPGAVERMIEVAGVMRTFTVSIPDPYDPQLPHPVAFGFHGLGGTGGGYYIPGGLDPAPIVIGPNAEPAGGAWNTSGDLEFVDAILDTVSAELCLDLTRVFASGYSNGGFMADAVACQRAEVFRGVAVMEGGSAGGFGCGQTAMWIMHNQDDMSVPLSYGTTLRDQWLAANGCAQTTQPIAPDPCVVYDGCTAGNPVVWCSPATGGHNPNYDAAAAVPGWWNSL
jgi:poly(3-hydroxybutyrate) depolymerase